MMMMMTSMIEMMMMMMIMIKMVCQNGPLTTCMGCTQKSHIRPQNYRKVKTNNDDDDDGDIRELEIYHCYVVMTCNARGLDCHSLACTFEPFAQMIASSLAL